MGKYSIRTDLAVEMQEIQKSYKKQHENIGYYIEEIRESEDINVIKVIIENEEATHTLGKPKGNYITIEAKKMSQSDESYNRDISEVISKYIKELLPDKESIRALVVGLGNRNATPDALGPKVIDNLLITRNITDEYGNENIISKINDEVSGIAPGVMAQTGMESLEIVKGIVSTINPDVVIAVDALAARSTKRLATTVQISDAGINPGSGVGNHRHGITKETVGIPVIAIGIPTVVDAATIVNDTFENLIDIFEYSETLKGMAKALKNFSNQEKHQLVREILTDEIGMMYVTPKDIDETIKNISFTVSEALNILFSGSI